jgi:hypothetical protein
MKKEQTHITFLLDRTGSMSVVKADTIKGFNAFLKEQQLLEGSATMLLAQFDSTDPFEIIEDFVDIKKVKKLNNKTFIPRNSTPLYDSIAKSINYTEATINNMKRKERPNTVIVAILTDGRENDSKEFNREYVRKLIEKKNSDGWQFIFLSADLESIKDAKFFGIHESNTVRFTNDSGGIKQVYSTVCDMVSTYRSNNGK